MCDNTDHIGMENVREDTQTDAQRDTQTSANVVEKHLREALNETEPSEKNYYIRVALQQIVFEKANRY